MGYSMEKGCKSIHISNTKNDVDEVYTYIH